jgi:RNA recognition motif-containing protein
MLHVQDDTGKTHLYPLVDSNGQKINEPTPESLTPGSSTRKNTQSEPMALSESQSQTTIYVPNIGNDITKVDLSKFFEQFGLVENIYKSNRKGPNGRYALVSYYLPWDAKTAMKSLNKDHKMKIKMANNRGTFALKEQENQTSSFNSLTPLKILST